MLPIWALDIDGVINAISNKTPNIWSKDKWIVTKANCMGINWPIMAATPIIELINEVHSRGLAKVMWHTTWQNEANHEFAEKLGLPQLEVLKATEETLTAAEFQIYREQQHYHDWWKLPAIKRLINEGNRVLWTDDDISIHVNKIAECFDKSLLICPRTNLGLTPGHAKMIRTYLEM